MTALIITKYLHFLGILGLAGTLLTENILISKRMSRGQLRKLSLVDAGYGLSAMLAVTGGLILWFGVGKPAAYYHANWIFLSKVGIVTLMGILSIWPTIFFLKNGKKTLDQTEHVSLPAYVLIIVRIQAVLLLLLVPLLASLMAYGFGAVA
ncbi:MAG: DUF2214 family protein [Cyclobacteriaceae bacterium]